MVRLFVLIIILMMPASRIFADDAGANELLSAAAEAEKANDFSAACKKYRQAEVLADDSVLKSNLLKAQTRMNRKMKRYGAEFDCIQRLIKEHLPRINFQLAVDRQYQIADLFFDGHRDVIVDWFPFIKGENKTVECYETALKNASLSKYSPDARLRLGRLYIDDQKPELALQKFIETMELHPETDAARYAAMELANTYKQLAARGDGDGKWAEQAEQALTEFIKKHPNDQEIPWAKKSVEEIHEIVSKRLYGLALYYHRNGRDDLAQRYLARVVRDYSNTEHAVASEKLLAKLDETYKAPAGDVPREEKVKLEFKRNTIPLENSPILVAPENSDGKWLLPVRDLKKNIKTDSRELPQEREFNDENL